LTFQTFIPWLGRIFLSGWRELIRRKNTGIRKTVLDYYPKVKKTEDYNTSVGLLGVIVPWYLPASVLSDARKADLVELVALKKRNNHLVNLERQNGCGFEHATMPVENADTWIEKVKKWLPDFNE